ncbi:phosphotransferase [Bacillus sp. JCM 19041]|uniref:aminoglycoside phosphotransferase family protein n=1 Tax=Bacillus sp. JCM 19041 TaxID=1460637 RepID=UPI0006D1B44F
MNESLIKQIPLIKDCQEVVEIKKGFSFDEKYLITMQDRNRKLLLRMFRLEEVALKKEEYTILEKMQDYHITCSRPIAFGEIGDRGYMITSYIEGEDAEEVIQTYSDEEQYVIGFEAGRELRKMHQLPAPSDLASWYSRKVKKHQNYLDAYATCGVKVKQDDKIMNFINENIDLMKQRPNVFQHDDFHLGNLIIQHKTFAGVIDFNRYDWGDPIHEFLKIGIFSRQVSVPFSIGQIKGYFDNQEPDDLFWRLYSLYLAMCVFSTVVWTLKTHPNNMDEMLEKVYMYLEDHEYFSNIKPKWYRSDFH